MKKCVFLAVLIAALFVPSLILEEQAAPAPRAASADAAEDTASDFSDTYIPEEYQRFCVQIGERYHLLPELLMAMIERESRGRPDAKSSGGDSGLLQVNPKWHRTRMKRLGVTDLHDPYSNILVAADYLAELFEQEEDLYLVLMKYNMKHSSAQQLYVSGVYSEYATWVTQRAWELEKLHEGRTTGW